MLERLMFWVILGHFVGDYLFQSKAMALGKSAPGWKGIKVCLWHCWVYSLAVYVTVLGGFGHWLPVPPGFVAVLPMVFLTHYPIDRWSLGGWWLKLIDGRLLIETEAQHSEQRLFTEAQLQLMAMDRAFAAIVYTVVDNTLHILLMLAGFATLSHWGVI